MCEPQWNYLENMEYFSEYIKQLIFSNQVKEWTITKLSLFSIPY